MSLAEKSLSGFFWSFGSNVGTRVTALVVGIILARLLTPADFGLVAMLYIFFQISHSFVNSGFSQALIREKEISEEDKSTTFYVNILVSLLFYFLLWIAAPLIASFYQQPKLLWLTRFMGLSVIFNALTIVQSALLTQELNFKSLSYVEIGTNVITGGVAITLAFRGFGVWALAVNYVLRTFIRSIFFWIINPWKPIGFINKKSFKKLFGFGSKLLASGLIETTYQNIYKLIIGKFFTASILGFFTQAQNLKNNASQGIVSSLQRVTYPILSKIKNEPERLKSGYRKIIQVTSFFVFPAMIGLAITAKPLIVTLMGEKWLPAVSMLQILCFSGILYHFHAINLNVLKVVGRSDLFLKLEVIKKINITIAIVIGLQFGIWGLLIGQVISSYIALYINMYYTSTFINYSTGEQILDVLPLLLLNIPMIAILELINWFGFQNIGLQLILMIVAGVLTYGLTSIIYKTPPAKIVMDLLGPRIKFLRNFGIS